MVKFLQFSLCIAILAAAQTTAAQTVPVTFRFNMPHIRKPILITGVVTEIHQGEQDFRMSGPNSDGLQTITLNLPPGIHSYGYRDDMGPAFYRDPERPPGPEYDPYNSFITVSDPMVAYTFPVDKTNSALRQGDPIEVHFEHSIGSPIDPESVEVSLDGQLIANSSQYYDAVEKVFSFTPPDLIPSGEHSIRIRAESPAGKLDKTVTFTRALDVDIQNKDFVLRKSDVTIYGQVAAAGFDEVAVIVNGQETVAQLDGNSYAAPVDLDDGENLIRVVASSASAIVSHERTMIADLAIEPEVAISGSVGAESVTLEAIADSPLGRHMTFSWTGDSGNPSPVSFGSPMQSTTTIEIPAKEGDYYIRVDVTDEDGRESYARRFIRRSVTGLALNGGEIYPEWFDNAIFYELTPWNFSPSRDIAGVEARLDEIKDLGANAIYLMPIFKTEPEENCSGNYEMVDYFSVEVKCGTEDDFRRLMESAHARDMRVILDLTFNHSSDRHPFLQNAVKLRDKSPYSHYYIWKGEPGNSEYEYSGWTSFALLNVADEEVREYLARVAEYWIREFDVDGFRLDTAEDPHFRDDRIWQTIFERVKRLRPDALLMAEASLDRTNFFEDRFDVVYDPQLRDELEWLLQGVGSISDLDVAIRVLLPPGGIATRYGDKNNFDRFISQFGPNAALLAHALVFTVHGIPRIWAGSEYGVTTRVFDFDTPIDRSDPNGIRDQYRDLLTLRKTYISNDAKVVRVPNDIAQVYSYASISHHSVIVSVLNFSDTPSLPTIDLAQTFSTDSGVLGFLKELYPDPTQVSLEIGSADKVAVALDPYGFRIFQFLSDELFNSGFEQPKSDTPPPPKTFAVNPASTFLRSSPDDPSLDALVIDLNDSGFLPGMDVKLTQVGQYIPVYLGTDGARDLAALFSSSEVILDSSERDRVPGAIDWSFDTQTFATCGENPQPTDIEEDFRIDPSAYVTIPDEGRYLIVGVPDCYNSDNMDPDGDFGVRIELR